MENQKYTGNARHGIKLSKEAPMDFYQGLLTANFDWSASSRAELIATECSAGQLADCKSAMGAAANHSRSSRVVCIKMALRSLRSRHHRRARSRRWRRRAPWLAGLKQRCAMRVLTHSNFDGARGAEPACVLCCLICAGATVAVWPTFAPCRRQPDGHLILLWDLAHAAVRSKTQPQH